MSILTPVKTLSLKINFLKQCFFICMCALGLAACGQTGELKLPPEKPANTPQNTIGANDATSSSTAITE